MANDFSKGKVSSAIIAQTIPLVLAQMAQLLYNVIDRIYIGHLQTADNLALTGVGLVFPLATLIAAFTALFGTGGAPLFAIARGAKDDRRAEKILSNVFVLLVGSSFLLMAAAYLLQKPILYLFGASDASYVYADAYLKIYLLGTPFLMLSTGLNGFINAQGYPRIGMMTVALGALLNLILDPVFIFLLKMGVAGAATATVLSQAASAFWVLRFLTASDAPLKIRRSLMKPEPPLVAEILSLGTAGFIMQGTNCLVQVVCNMMLKQFGGDLYVGVMTVLNAVREILTLPVMGLTSGAQPVLGYNFGAGAYGRVRQGIRFMALIGILYTTAAWFFVFKEPHFLMTVFTKDETMIEFGAQALHIYFFGFFFMAFQFIGQSAFTALECSKRAIFFSLFRKAIIVAPLTVLLPHCGFGVAGVFLAEPISNAIGGTACFITMYLTVYRRLEKLEQKQ